LQLKPPVAHFHVDDGNDLHGVAAHDDAVGRQKAIAVSNENAVAHAGLALHPGHGFAARQGANIALGAEQVNPVEILASHAIGLRLAALENQRLAQSTG
jgi:hypothetical protein